MKNVCYEVKAYPKVGYKIKEFKIQTPDYQEERVISIILEVHPEWHKLELKRVEGLFVEWEK